jgi:hypothetical protein
MRVWEWMRAVPLRELVACLGAVLTVAAVALVRLVVAFRRRVVREEPVLRCIREFRWDAAWAAGAYRERLAKRLLVQLGIGARQYAVRGGGQVDLSFDYQGTTWFIAVHDRLQSLQRTQFEQDIAELLVDCTERRVARPTVAVVVGLPNGRHDNLQLRALRGALMSGAARPPRAAASDFNFEVVAVPQSYPPTRTSQAMAMDD